MMAAKDWTIFIVRTMELLVRFRCMMIILMMETQNSAWL